jgi:hypothetical protein
MGGGGGPVNRIHLATGKVSPILEHDDRRLPKGRRYVYFPMLSPNQRLFAFAAAPASASDGSVKSDYDVFVSACDPQSLTLLGRPVRYTFRPPSDRFPDVFLGDLELGRRDGEAPLTVDLGERLSGDWRWDFGAGSVPASAGRHTFRKPGEYVVTARQGDKALRGHVRVRPAAPPRVRGAMLSRDKREIRIVFDEPVRVGGARLRLASATEVRRWQLEPTHEVLRVILERPIVKADAVLIEGVTDRAQCPNAMPPARVPIRLTVWPARRDALVFLWENGDRPNLVEGAAGAQRTYPLRLVGPARLDHSHALHVVAGGSAEAAEAGDDIVAACRKTNAFSLELTVHPAEEGARRSGRRRPARFLALHAAADARQANVALAQGSSNVLLLLKTPKTAARRDWVNHAWVSLQVELSAQTPTHIVVTYTPGRLIAYANGTRTLETERLAGDLSNWSPGPLVLGGPPGRRRSWQGKLQGVCIYSRVLSADEVRQGAANFHRILRAGKPVPSRTVEAELVARSAVPKLEDLAPYRQALAVFEYRAAGPPRRFRVAHWVILDGKVLPAAGWKVGERYALRLEPFADNPQVHGCRLSDTLKEAPELPFYHEVGR